MSRANQVADTRAIGAEITHRPTANRSHQPKVIKPEDIICGAGLPEAASELILRVVGQCRLWRSERIDLAREMVAHFADGLNRGESEHDMIDTFGDADQAARLIRRAKKRNRPWPWKVGRIILLATALLLLWVVVLMVRFYIGAPTISHDYREDLNRAALAVEPSEAAWPLYCQALLKLPSMDKELGADPDPYGVRPGEYSWPEVQQFLTAHADAIEMVRQAAARRGMGFVVGQPLNDVEKQIWPYHEPGDYNEEGMYSILLPHLGDLRRVCKLLASDFRRALAEGDVTTAVRDVEAIIGIAKQVRETPILINDLVSLAVLQMTCERVMDGLAAPASKGLDRELDRLAVALDAVQPDTVRARLGYERFAFHDLVQRIYTDDGNGNGRMTPKGMKFLENWTSIVQSVSAPGIAQEPSWHEAVTTIQPVMAMIMLDRRDLLATHERLMKAAETEALVPLWQRAERTYDQELDRWKASPTDRIRYLPLVMMMPALWKAGEQGELVRQNIDAVRTAVALARYRRDHGSWPSSLGELAPSYLPEIPVDRFDGQPLKYRLGDDGPVLYSVGTDRDDDGGLRPADEYGARRFVTPSSLAPMLANGQVPDGDWVMFPPSVEPLRVEPPKVDEE